MPFKSEKQRRWMHANEPKMAKKWEKKEKKMKETKVKNLILKMVREEIDEMNEAGKAASAKLFKQKLCIFSFCVRILRREGEVNRPPPFSYLLNY